MTKHSMEELVAILKKACEDYYDNDCPSMSDKEYDALYDELVELESSTGIVLPDSPTVRVQGNVSNKFEKVEHVKPMLSCQKTKSISDIESWVNNKKFYASYKLDGISLCLSYNKGRLVRAVTRGNGIIGEDVTANAKYVKGIPQIIPYVFPIELRGECLISWENFNKVNENLKSSSEVYSHPRNLAAGTIRQLNPSIVKDRGLSFVVFEVVSGFEGIDNKLDLFKYIEGLGFEVVKRCTGTVEECYNALSPDSYKYPVDGIVFEYCSISYGKSLGATAHHELQRIALKWKDDTKETTLRDVIWQVGKTGVITPVAVFDEVDLDGAKTTRATLHNISIVKKLKLGLGDTITIYRSNMVIPKVDENLTMSDTLEIPKYCPSCGETAYIEESNNSSFLICKNDYCPAKIAAKLSHFVERNGVNIDGLSDRTLEDLTELGWVNNFVDIYHLSSYKDNMVELEGFGKTSVNKLLSSIEKSRNIKLENFLYAVSIPNIGISTAKTISKFCDGDIEKFIDSMDNNYDFTSLPDFGDTINDAMHKWWESNREMVTELSKEFSFVKVEKATTRKHKSPVEGLTVCITGKLNNYTRDELTALIEEQGGKVASAVSKNTNCLVTNETIESAKYKKAVELGISIISEDEFVKLFINK